MRSLLMSLLLSVSYPVAYAQQTSGTSEPGSPSPASGESSSAIKVSASSYNPEEADLKSFGVSFFSLGGVNTDQFKKGGTPSYFIYDGYLSFNFKVNRNLRFAARPAFNYSTEGLDYRGTPVTNKMQTRDFSLLATGYNVFEDYLPPSWDLKAQVRLYLPTAESSKAEGMISRLRFEFESRYYYGRYSNVRAYVKPSYYFQRTTSYLNEFGSLRTTNLGDVQHGAEVDVNLNKYFSVKPGFELEDSWTNQSDVNSLEPRHTTTIAYRLGLEVRPLKVVNFTVGYQDRRDLVQTDRVNDTSYSLMTNVRVF